MMNTKFSSIIADGNDSVIALLANARNLFKTTLSGGGISMAVPALKREIQSHIRNTGGAEEATNSDGSPRQTANGDRK